jgi:hypothetical protein
MIALVLSILALAAPAAPPQSPSATPLRIVVLAGEDAVNVIQQKTAVAPLVEIRDRNNVPVAGATVTFTISGNSAAFAGGAQTLTVVTNAAGQAAAAGISPIASGAVQINVAAAFQGQTIAATIAQTNVLTAAEAAGAAASSASASGAAGGSTGSASGAAGGAAGGGGGISGTTLGIVGAAVAGGAVAATQVGGSDESSGQGARTYSGTFSSSIVLAFQGCTRTQSWSGTLEIVLRSSDPLSGDARIINGTSRVESGNCGGGPQAGATENLGMPSTPMTGTAANMEFTSSVSNNFPPSAVDPVGGINTTGFKFTGALNGSEITGTLNHSRRIESANGTGVPGTGSASVSVTLR